MVFFNKGIVSDCVKKFINSSLLKKIYFVLFLILIIYLICLGIAPANRIQKYHDMVINDSLFSVKYDSMYDHPEILPLLIEKTYKEALLKLSEQDSIQLIVNLHDSLVCLSIKGVIIHETHVNDILVDKVLRRLPGREFVKLFSQPIAVLSQTASIDKEPIVVRDAPKDSLEASLTAYKPDTLIQNPAFLMIRCDFGIKLILEQYPNSGFHDKWVRFIFRSKLWIKNVLTSIVRFFSFRKQEYNPTIIIKMPVDDLRAIYRALPLKASVVLTYYPEL